MNLSKAAPCWVHVPLHRIKASLGAVLLLFVIAADSPPDRVVALKNAAALVDSHDLRGAEAALKPLLAASPNDALALNLMGLVQAQQQHTTEAEQLFLRAIESNGKLPGPHVNLALLYGVARYKEAFEQLRIALELTPENGQARKTLRELSKVAALQTMKSGDSDEALAILVGAKRFLPEDPDLLYELGMVALSKGLLEDAQHALETSVRLRPSYDSVHYALARTYLE